MSHPSKRSAVLIGSVLVGLMALSALFSHPVSAAVHSSATPQSCYSDFQHFTAHFDSFQQRTTASRSFHATSRCRDINLQFRGLLYPTTVTPYTCSGHLLSAPKLVRPSDGWRIIATNVRDGTCFTLTLQRTQGLTSYTVAGFVAA